MLAEGPVYKSSETPLGDPIGLLRRDTDIEYRDYSPDNEDGEMISDEELNRELLVIQGEAYALNVRLMKLIEKREIGKEQNDGNKEMVAESND